MSKIVAHALNVSVDLVQLVRGIQAWCLLTPQLRAVGQP